MAAIFGRFSGNSEALLVETQTIANQLGKPVSSEVVLLAILAQPGTLAATLLKNVGVSQPTMVERVTASPSKEGMGKEMQFLLEESIKLAGRFRFSNVEIEHMLFVIAKEQKLSGYKLLVETGIDPRLIVNRLTEWLFSVAMLNQGPNNQEMTESRGNPDKVELEKFVFDVTEAAKNHTLDPVIGRDKEVEQLIHILLRRRKNNPLLIGEPGVGKTALVDALAQRIIQKRVPQALAHKRVLTLDLGLVVAGTMYRGQFEERLKGIVQEIQNLGNCILFIDEIHTLSGTGSSEGGFDAANILKPALARGEITVIGATTHDEYRKHILKDKALDRRFQTLTIEEPSEKEAIAMLKGLKRDLEQHHKVMIMEDAIQAAVELSQRYIHDRFLPDKAIDVLDQAATFHAEAYRENTELLDLQQEIALVATQKSEAALQGDYEIAKAYMEKENQLLSQLEAFQNRKAEHTVHKPVTSSHVAMVISSRTGVPITEVQQTLEPINLKRVKTVLSKFILGQEEAIKTISQTLMRAQLGLQPKGKPMGSFLLVGPTGVGKTETARVLAREIFGDQRALIKIDMSEFMERHTVSNLIGAPAGYVGFEQGGSLTEQVRRRPYSVVLFDEVEKAHPDVFNLLLQILEDGYVTDNTGNTVSFAHTFIIMTSNVGMESFNQVARIGFSFSEEVKEKEKRERQELQSHIQGEIEDFFRPELLGRLSGIIFYNPLDKKVVQKLIEKRMKALVQQLAIQDIILTNDGKVIDYLVEKYEPEAGARSIERVFLQHVEPVIIKTLMQSEEKKVMLTVKRNQLAATES